MIFLFPLAVAFTIVTKNGTIALHKNVSIVIGFLLAVVYSFIDLFFTSAYYLAPYAFLPNFFYSFLYDTLIPIVICSLFLLLFVRRFDFKWCELYLFLLGFYTVYFPARSFNVNEVFSWYELFIKPLVTVSMVFAIKNISLFLSLYLKDSTKYPFKKSLTMFNVFIVILCILSLFMPSIIETLYLLDMSVFTWALFSLLYSFAIVYGSSFFHKKIIKAISDF